jgi:hypothetical protein
MILILFLSHQFAVLSGTIAELGSMFAPAAHALAGYAAPGQCSGLPTISDAFFTSIIKWIAKIISGVAVLALVWSAAQQIQHRDWGKLGGEVIGILMLILIISKADTIVTTLLTMAGISAATC